MASLSEAVWTGPVLRSRYRCLFIIDSRGTFESVRHLHDPESDLVLTYDLGLRRDIERAGGTAHYIDRLVDAETMRRNNHRVYEFFARWNLDADDRDIFEHAGVPFGFSFRLEFWNDLVFHARMHLCVERVLELGFDELHVGTANGVAEAVLRERGVVFSPVRPAATLAYYFPIHAWMAANIRHAGVKALLLERLARGAGAAARVFDRVRPGPRRPAVFMQEYHPTVAITQRLRAENRVRVVVVGPTRDHPLARFIPMPARRDRYRHEADRLLREFRDRRSASLVLTTGRDISESVFALIEARIRPQVPEAIRKIDGTIRHLERDPLALIVLIANIGETVTVVHCVCRARGIPSYLIINGLLAVEFGDESKHATVINAYSTSIRNHYFRGMDNIVCLGDPRMDTYPPMPRRAVDPERFVVTIGAGGYNPTDLNSHVAVEFDFLADVLAGLERVKARCPELRVIIKVRANGYRAQYTAFAAEFFPGLVDEILDTTPIAAVLDRTDFYISIYSQTLFEASCKGIPVLYYRIADYYKYPPFDGRSELVTANSADDVERAIVDARAGHSRFDAFLDRRVMEQYIGPLDGGNVERNIAMIYELSGQSAAGRFS